MAKLTEAQMQERLERVKQGSYDAKWDVNEVDGDGRTLLHFAASDGILEAVELLIKKVRISI